MSSKAFYNDQGQPAYSSATTAGTKLAVELLEKMSRQPVQEDGTRPMLVPPPLPRRRSEMR